MERGKRVYFYYWNRSVTGSICTYFDVTCEGTASVTVQYSSVAVAVSRMVTKYFEGEF